MSVNRVILLGNLGRDPELRHTQGGHPVANFTMATNERWTDKQGQKQERTEWHRVIVWGRQAELCAEYLRKGQQAYVEGRIQTRDWQDKDGQERKTTEIVAQQVVFLRRDDSGGGSGGGYGGGGSSGGGSSGGGSGEQQDGWGDVPF